MAHGTEASASNAQSSVTGFESLPDATNQQNAFDSADVVLLHPPFSPDALDGFNPNTGLTRDLTAIKARLRQGGQLDPVLLGDEPTFEVARGASYAKLAASEAMQTRFDSAETLARAAEQHTPPVAQQLLARAVLNLAYTRSGRVNTGLDFPWYTPRLEVSGRRDTRSPEYREAIREVARIHIFQGRADRLSGRDDLALAHAIDARRILDEGATDIMPGINNAALSYTDRLEIASLTLELTTTLLGQHQREIPATVEENLTEAPPTLDVPELELDFKRSLADIRTIVAGQSTKEIERFRDQLQGEGFGSTIAVVDELIRERYYKRAVTMRTLGHSVYGLRGFINRYGELQVQPTKYDIGQTASAEQLLAAIKGFDRRLARLHALSLAALIMSPTSIVLPQTMGGVPENYTRPDIGQQTVSKNPPSLPSEFPPTTTAWPRHIYVPEGHNIHKDPATGQQYLRKVPGLLIRRRHIALQRRKNNS